MCTLLGYATVLGSFLKRSSLQEVYTGAWTGFLISKESLGSEGSLQSTEERGKGRGWHFLRELRERRLKANGEAQHDNSGTSRRAGRKTLVQKVLCAL